MKTAQRIEALVEDERIHRDLYLSEALFALEQQRLFARTWLFAGHLSQVPEAGDYVQVALAGRPLLLIRQDDGSVRVLHNRCAHKGAPLVSSPAGHAGRSLRCPYHAWSYRLDGSLLGVPLKQAYEGTSLSGCEAARGLAPVGATAVHRDFVFVRLASEGIAFEDYFGPALGAIDDLVDRSPTGRLVVAGGVIRNTIRCNWKTYLENINDTVHPLTTHVSATQSAVKVWGDRPADEPKPMAMEQILPFGAGLDFFDRMGGRVFANGHSLLGVNFSIHSAYAALPEYEAALRTAHGDARADHLLGRAPQNAVLYPSLSVKGQPLAIRVIRPLAADRTVIEAWSFRADGAPALLHERALSYNRLVFSPMSVVAHDDVHLFQGIQASLRADGNEWISLHRGFDPAETADPADPDDPDETGTATRTVGGTNELLMRNQYRAWRRYMTANEDATASEGVMASEDRDDASAA